MIQVLWSAYSFSNAWSVLGGDLEYIYHMGAFNLATYILFSNMTALL